MKSHAFRCPECNVAGLRIIASLELGGDSITDEITVQMVRCASCSALAAAVYEESRRGRLGSEVGYHTGYRMPADRARELLARLRSCPQPGNYTCRCPAHLELRVIDEATGRWVGLEDWAGGSPFPLDSPR
jgi:hypothetical protein